MRYAKMKTGVRIFAKMLFAVPICLLTIMGPFFLQRWLHSEYGIDIPSLIIFLVAFPLTFTIWIKIFKKEIKLPGKQ